MHAPPSLPPFRLLFVETWGRFGGAQRSLLELAAELRLRGTAPIVATPPGPLFDALRDARIQALPLPAVPPGQPWRLLPAARRLRHIIRSLDPRIIHANSPLAALLPPASTPAKRLFHIRDLRVNPLLLRVAASRVHAIAAISPPVLRRFHSLIPGPVLIPNGIDLTPFNAAFLHRPPLSSHPPRIGMVAQWAAWKHHDTFIRLAPLLRRHHPSAEFFILPGDAGTDAGWQRRMRCLAACHHVNILPPCRDMPSFYASLTLLVHPPADEPFGRVYYESLATGTPVVAHASAVPPLPAFRTVHAAAPDAFAAVVHGALLELRAPPRAVAWQDLCHATAQDFGIRETAGACLALYARLLRAPAPA